MFDNIYQGRRVLVTGHTGFKGSWLVRWLDLLGASVTGISLDPSTTPNHWDCLNLDIANDHRCDIRESERVASLIKSADPQIIFHLAAQPLVRRSYRDPLETWSTNVMGTANVLNACRELNSLKAMVMVTTDKVYENNEWPWGYRETDTLGGHDPYSASKGCCEILVSSYQRSFFNEENSPLIATARAGNVIGGGDWSEDRLIPDLIRATISSSPLEIRSPMSTRPWQHVLECLGGYLSIGRELLSGKSEFASAWNFGPDVCDNRTVTEILEKMQGFWPKLKWRVSDTPQPHEASLLSLDCSKSKHYLKWSPVWELDEAIRMTADWYRNMTENDTIITSDQIVQFQTDAIQRGRKWAT